MNEYTRANASRRLLAAGVNLNDPGPLERPDAPGAEFPGVEKERAALVKAEAAFSEVFVEVAEQESSASFVSAAVKDETNGRAAERFEARKLARVAFREAVEGARDAADEACDVEEAELLAEVLSLLDLIEPKLQRAGVVAEIRSAAKDKNPLRRHELKLQGRPVGGTLVSQLRAAVANVGTADYYILPGDQHERYLRGEAALDVFGNEVPAGLPLSRVRRSYTAVRDVPVEMIRTQGGT